MSDARIGASSPAMAWLEELKQNRKTQAGLGAFALAIAFMGYMLWPDTPKARPRKVFSSPGLASQESTRTLQSLEKLPDLARLGQAGELPGEDRMYRDLFLFDGPPPKPVPQRVVPILPPKPPTEAELKALALQQAKDAAFATRPQGFRYLGFLERKSVGRIGAFVKNEEPLPIKLGETFGEQWKLAVLSDTFAEFQNLKFPELRHRIEAADAGSGPRGSATTNEF